MNIKVLPVLLLVASSHAAFAVCEHELRRYENFKQEAKNWGKASFLAVGAGSFFGPLGGLAGAGQELFLTGMTPWQLTPGGTMSVA